MIPNEEVLNREESNFPGRADITSIVDSLYNPLYQLAVGLTKSESDAADLVQETFLTFGQRLDQIRDFSKIKSWLFTPLRREFLLKIRRYKRHPEVQFLPDAHDFPTEIHRFGAPWTHEAFERRFCKSTKSTGWPWSFFI